MKANAQAQRYLFGQWVDASRPLSVADIQDLGRRARAEIPRMSQYPLDKILRILHQLGQSWGDPDYPPRKEMQERLPALTGFSPQMIRLGLDELPEIFNAENLRRKIATEFQGIPRSLGFEYRQDERGRIQALQWQPLGTVLHVLSGNVFLVGPGSLIEGLLTGNVTVLKMSSEERDFLPLFIRTLQEHDLEGVISSSIALIDYRSSELEVIHEIKQQIDGVVVWGGESAVQGYRKDLPARCRCIVFGPKLSLALISSTTLANESSLQTVARSLSEDMGIWDQNACTSPQICYVDDDAAARSLVQALAQSLTELEKKIPTGLPDRNTAVEIRKLRSIAEIADFRQQGMLRESGQDLSWTVILQSQNEIEVSPLHRTLRVVAVKDFSEVLQQLPQYRSYIQTVGLSVAPEQFLPMSRQLGSLGVLRVLPIGSMNGGGIDDPHDGAYDLPQLMNLVISQVPQELKASGRSFGLTAAERGQWLDSKAREIIDQARLAPYYQEVLSGLEIQGLADWPKIPLLSREKMESEVPPYGTGLTVGKPMGGYFARSGGSTGQPKFSHFDQQDWQSMIADAASVFERCGIRRGQRVANCMMAGDLYGSFVSFNAVNEYLGLTSFALCGNISVNSFYDVWKQFGFDLIQGVPIVVTTLMRACKERDPEFTIPQVMYAGQPMSAEDRRWLKDECGVKTITSLIGTTEAGHIAYQCPEQSGRTHHLLEGYNYVEVVDDQGQPVSEGEVGLLAVTTLEKRSQPLLRYLVGDQAKLLSGSCVCGHDSRRVDYLGRADEILSLGMMNLNYNDVMRALEDLPLSQVQLLGRVTEDLTRDELVIHAECSAEIQAARPGLKIELESALFQRVPEFEDHLNKGYFKLATHLHPTGTLARNPRSGKVKSVIDERV